MSKKTEQRTPQVREGNPVNLYTWVLRTFRRNEFLTEMNFNVSTYSLTEIKEAIECLKEDGFRTDYGGGDAGLPNAHNLNVRA